MTNSKIITEYKLILKILKSITSEYEQELVKHFKGKKVLHVNSSTFFNYGESTIIDLLFDDGIYFLVKFPGLISAEYFETADLVFINE